MIEMESGRKIEQSQNNHKDREIEVDLMEVFYKIIDLRRVLYKTACVGLVIGIIVAVSIPKQYTVKVILSPEVRSPKEGGLSGLAASFLGGSTSMNDGTDALNASLSAEIVSSTPFLLELLDIKVPINEKINITLGSFLDKESSPWWNYVTGLPNLLIRGVKSLFTNKDNKIAGSINNINKGVIELSEMESCKLESLKKMITTSVDSKTSMTSIAVTLQNPKVAAVLADSVVKKLQEYIIDYRTSKAKEDCFYLEILFRERQKEYYVAQKKYANYVDSHDNIILQSVRAELERLQNDMNLAYQVYSQVANQLQVARAKVQEEKPVFAVVEPAVIPLNSSSYGLKIWILIFVFFSEICTISWFLLGKIVWQKIRVLRSK